ncbi:MAG: DUF3747 domain-containing protein [Elainellaceae cyanobacterium]
MNSSRSTDRTRIRTKTLMIMAIASLGSLVSAPSLAVNFGQQDVNQSRFVAIASPVGASSHQLLILEQISDTRPCWREIGDNPTLIEPLLLNFDFTGICGRSTDSNGYSIRIAGDDLGLDYSLRIVNRDGNLVLLGAPFNRQGQSFEIGRADGVASDYVKITLNPEWRFTKRTYNGRTLGHVYLTRATPLPSPEPEQPAPPDPEPPESAPPESEPPEPSQEAAQFRDIAGDVYAQDIRAAVELGFIAGFPEDNTFRPLASLTREQLVSMVLEALRTLPDAELTIPTQANQNPYPDVSASRWSAAKIQFARSANIVSGYPDGSFRPTQAVTRAELIAILRRAAEYGKSLQSQSNTLEATQDPAQFADISNHWAASLITDMSAYCGVASPYNEQGSNFLPNQSAQRNYAAAATLRLVRCLQSEED